MYDVVFISIFQYLKVVEDALRKELNLNPQTSGTTITLPVKK